MAKDGITPDKAAYLEKLRKENHRQNNYSESYGARRRPLMIRHGKGVPFISGSPRLWELLDAIVLGRDAAAVFACLLWVRGMLQSETVRPTKTQWERCNIEKHNRQRGLKRLEDAKLITVERKQGALPTITFVWQDYGPEGENDETPDPFAEVQLSPSDYSMDAMLWNPACDPTSER